MNHNSFKYHCDKHQISYDVVCNICKVDVIRLELINRRLGNKSWDKDDYVEDMIFMTNEVMDLIDILIKERKK